VAQAGDHSAVGDRVTRLGRDASWRRVAAIPVAFRTFHPQGLVKVGERFFVSSVEVRVAPRRTEQTDGRGSRTAGEGVGHLFEMDASGRLLRTITLGEGSLYHPGGLDFDGRYIWVAVAEYRPDSRSVVYRVDPRTMTASEVLRVPDHLGAVVHDHGGQALHAVSWGSRRFYRWSLDEHGKPVDPGAPRRAVNPSHYVDYQDCQHAGARRMLCTGIAGVTSASGAPFTLGGLEMVSLDDGRPLHQVPVPLFTDSGVAMTRNPSWFEAMPSGLRAYFMPEDDTSTLYVYEVEGKPTMRVHHQRGTAPLALSPPRY
jgi:hypothetical protein